MPIVLSDIFTPAEAQVLHEAAQALDFQDGGRTAGPVAAAVKRNAQAAPGRAREAVLDKIRASLLAHPLFQAVAYPRAFAAMVLSRTESGGGYGAHIDNALMAGGRADLSFTLFLSPPDAYGGGALCIADRVEERRFKLGQGETVVYPSDTLHRVEPVTASTRLAVACWVTSRVADSRRREILFDLWQALGRAQAESDTEQGLLLSKSRSNLLRMWAV